MQPAKFHSQLQAATTHHRAGRIAEAELIYRQLRVAAPRHFDVLHLSGLAAYQQGRLPEAFDLLGRAHRVDPRHSVCELRLAAALLAAGRLIDAEKHLRHALALKPDLVEGWDTLATCLKAQDKLVEAAECHAKAVAIKPDFALGWVNYGFTLRLLNRPDEALACHQRALDVDPGFAPARFGRAQAWQLLHRPREAVAEYDAFLALEPQSLEARSNRLFALHNLEEISREQLFAEHVAYGRALKPAPAPRFGRSLEPQRRLRIAFLSPDLREHACAYFLEPLLRHLDRESFEIYLYHDHFREDAVSARLRPLGRVWRNISGQSTEQVETAIRADAPDILIDIAGHTGITNRLPVLHRKVAPVQVTYLGYPDTTGVPAVDYRFTDAIADPVDDGDQLATEKLVRFAPTAWAYLPSGDAPEVAALPALDSGAVTFGCFNDLAKITDSALAAWSRVLAGVPGARLRVKGTGLGEPVTRAWMERRMVAAGIAVERVELFERTPDLKSHFALYHGVDIALDAFPYNGTTTTCEALWMGVPVVTLRGDRHVARVGASLMTAIGHADWIAEDVEGYVCLATEWARRLPELAMLRAGLRGDMRRSPLLDHAGQADSFGAALRECWAIWCERQAPAELAAL